MADPFQPKFVDLVRNFTFTAGTGNLELGEAAPGFTSFAAALQPGDQFYYSVIGLENTTESEVGRGTLQADGSIGREAIGGTLTNFSSERKSVALIAAAEWFETIAAAVGQPAEPADGDKGDISIAGGVWRIDGDVLEKFEVAAPDRTALAAIDAVPAMTRYLTERGREGMFLFDGGDRSAEVAADARQGMYVAGAADPTGASGAWVRSLGPNRAVDATWFDLVGDGVTDNHAALNTAVTLAGLLDGFKTVAVPPGRYALAQSIAVPDGVTLEGSGPETVLIATGGAAGQPWIVNMSGGSNFAIRNLKMTPDASSVVYRSAISLTSVTHAKIENVIVEDQSDSTCIYLWDCDSVVIDNIYFDGGGDNHGYGVYAVGCKGCKIVNSSAINCNMGFVLSGDGIDPESTRTTAESFGNTIANCYVKGSTAHAFNVNSSCGNTISNCHAEDYAGVSTHKAFQSKDATGDDTRGNIFVGCSVKNYPTGFGGQRSSHAQFIGCTTRDNSTNGFELNGCNYFQVIGCSIYEFGGAGIWLGSSGTGNLFDAVRLQTSTATATGIKFDSLSGMSNGNFDNITTASTLAAFIDINATSNNNRFGMGCRANDNAIIDSSSSTIWPMVRSTTPFSLTAGSTTYMPAGYVHRGMHVTKARFVVTTTITGSPQVSAGTVVSAQAVTGSAGMALDLTITSALVNTGTALKGSCTAAGSAGAGFVQFEGLPRL